MKNRNLFVLLSLLSMPTGYLYAAAESEEGRARREGQEAAERALIDQALLVDSAGFSEDDMRRAKAQSLGLDDTEEKVKEESAGIEGAVNSITLSPHSYMIASVVGNDICLYEVETGTQVNMLKGHTCSVSSVAFSPDGQYIVSVSRDNRVRIWFIATGECLRTLQVHNHLVKSVAFSPDGRCIVSGSGDNMVRLCDIAVIFAAQNQELGALPDEYDKEAGEEAGEGKMEVAGELEEASEVAVGPTVEQDQEFGQGPELQEEEPLTPEQLRAARLACFERNKQ